MARFTDDLEAQGDKLARVRTYCGTELYPAGWSACPEHGATLRVTGGPACATSPMRPPVEP